MRRLRYVALWLAIFIVALVLGRVLAPETDPEPTAADSLATGRQLFGLYCAKCHGIDGRGDPEMIATLNPPPRDFQARPWRFDVSERSIRRVIQVGIPGTAMVPNAAAFQDDQLDALAAYVMTLAEPQPASAPPMGDKAWQWQSSPTPLPEVHLVDALGNETRLSELAGSRALIHFWGTDCSHCLAELAEMPSRHLEHEPTPLRVISLCVDQRDPAEAQAVADRVAPGHRVHSDPRGLIGHQFGVSALPAYRLVVDGQIVATRVGSFDWSQEELLDEN